MISTALRTGNPLPQVTPCPLLDRFIRHHHGLNVIRNEEDDDYGLPRTMSIDVLENEQYMQVHTTVTLPSNKADVLDRCFCVGVSTSFGIITRFDRLMHATKELVGEQYHIHGVGYVAKVGGVEMEMGSSTNSLRPIHDA
jgi:Aromatic acid exporter family member 2